MKLKAITWSGAVIVALLVPTCYVADGTTGSITAGTARSCAGAPAFRFSIGPGITERVDETWKRFIMACQHARGELVEGRPEPVKALWSHAPLGLRHDRMFLRFLRADVSAETLCMRLPKPK